MKLKPTVLVTGGAGLIGRHVADALLATESFEVVVLDDLSGGIADNVPSGAELVEGSICDAALLESLFAERSFRYVYHLAAYAAEGLSHFIRRFNYQNNLIGSANLINESVKHGVECFVFTSSIAVYGSIPPPMSETDRPAPEDPYGIAKLAVEWDLQAAHRLFGLDYVIFRPHNVYGEYQNLGDPYRNVIGIFMKQVLSGRPLTIFGDGSQTRAFSYVGDVAPVIARSPLVVASRNRVFNLGSDTPTDLRTLANAVCRAMGEPDTRIRNLDARKETAHAFANHEAAREVFGLKDEISLEEGLGRMAAWARGVGTQKARLFSKLELEKNLPESWRRLVR